MLDDLAAIGYEFHSLSELSQSGLRYRDAIPVLLDWLPRISDNKARQWVARALTVPWAKPIATVPLIEEFRRLPADEDPTGSTRWAIGNALEVLYDDSVYEDIVDLVLDRGYGTARQMLVFALEKSKRSEVDEILVSLLDDRDVDGQVIEALGKRRASSAKDAVEAKLDDDRPWVRQSARKALRRMS